MLHTGKPGAAVKKEIPSYCRDRRSGINKRPSAEESSVFELGPSYVVS